MTGDKNEIGRSPRQAHKRTRTTYATIGGSTSANTNNKWDPSFPNTANKKISKQSDLSIPTPYLGQNKDQNYGAGGRIMTADEILNGDHERPMLASQIPQNFEENFNQNPQAPLDLQNFKDYIVSDSGTVYKKHADIVHDNGKPSLKLSYLPLGPYKEEVLGPNHQPGQNPQYLSHGQEQNYRQNLNPEDGMVTETLKFHANVV